YLLAAGFGMGVASSVADISVGLARKSAGINDMDDNLRLIFAPLGFIPVGKTAGQVGKQVGKRIGRNILRSFTRKQIERMSEYVTRLYEKYAGKYNKVFNGNVVNKIPIIQRSIEDKIIITKTGKEYKEETYAFVRFFRNFKRIPEFILINKIKFETFKNHWKKILTHEITHINLTYPKFIKKFLPGAEKEIKKLIKNEKLEEMLVDILSAKQLRGYAVWLYKIKRYNFLKKEGDLTNRFLKETKKRYPIINKRVLDIKNWFIKRKYFIPAVIPFFCLQKEIKNIKRGK
ncbi:MAG: hypothetical protein QXN00_01465, partial [Candidatus Aenigmatarchaeota archaeon]